MSLGLLLPAGLSALTALGVPLIVHLIRRHTDSRTLFAALRWIPVQVFPHRRLRLERPWLLLIRLLLVAALALLLATPVWRETRPAPASWVVAVPGVRLADILAATHDETVEPRWLAPGFPPLSEPPASSSLPVASLLRELDAQLPAQTTLTVVTPDILSGWDGERPHWQHAIDWQVVSTASGPPPSLPPPLPRQWAVRYTPETVDALPYLQALASFWTATQPAPHPLDRQPIDAGLPAIDIPLIWLAPATPAVQHWIEQGGTALLASAAEHAASPSVKADINPLPLQPQGAGYSITLPGRFLPQDWAFLLDDAFPAALHTALFGSPPPPDRASIDVMQAPPSGEGLSLPLVATDPVPLDPGLIGLVALLLLLERGVARWPRSVEAA